jgi:hypothetical protein
MSAIPDTCVEQIMDKIAERLALITTTNGYSQTVTKIDKNRISPFKGYDLPKINFWNQGLEWDYTADQSYEEDKRILPVFIEGYCIKWEDGAQETAERFGSDIITCLYRGVDKPTIWDKKNYDFDGLVSAIKPQSLTYVVDESATPFCGCLVLINVEFFAEYGNMFEFETI